MAASTVANFERTGNENFFYAADAQARIGLVMFERGYYRESEAHLRRVYEGFKKKLGQDHLIVAFCGLSLADTLAAQNKTPEAIALYESALSVYQTTTGKDDRRTLLIGTDLAAIQGTIKVTDEMITAQQASLQTLIKTFGETHPDVMRTRLVLAKLQFQNNQLQQAQDLLDKTLPKLRENFGDQHRDTIRALDLLSQIHRKRGDFAESLKLAEEIAKSHPRFVESPHFVGSLQTHHAETLIDLRRYAEAERVLAAATENVSRADGAPRSQMEALVLAHIVLYGQWQKAQASGGNLQKTGLWQRRLEALKGGAGSLEALKVE
jgi:tetratricopeptide (TPR) repeat protein